MDVPLGLFLADQGFAGMWIQEKMFVHDHGILFGGLRRCVTYRAIQGHPDSEGEDSNNSFHLRQETLTVVEFLVKVEEERPIEGMVFTKEITEYRYRSLTEEETVKESTRIMLYKGPAIRDKMRD